MGSAKLKISFVGLPSVILRSKRDLAMDQVSLPDGRIASN